MQSSGVNSIWHERAFRCDLSVTLNMYSRARDVVVTVVVVTEIRKPPRKWYLIVCTRLLFLIVARAQRIRIFFCVRDIIYTILKRAVAVPERDIIFNYYPFVVYLTFSVVSLGKKRPIYKPLNWAHTLVWQHLEPEQSYSRLRSCTKSNNIWPLGLR